MLVQILQLIVAFTVVLFGLVSLFAPVQLGKAVGLTGDDKGVAELRIGWGGLYVAMGAGALLLGTPAVYQLVGLMFGAMGITRLAHILLGKVKADGMYWGILGYELVVLVIGFLPTN